MRETTKILIHDAHNAAWRSMKQLPRLTTPYGMEVQVVYGVLRILRTTVEQFEPSVCIVCWDEGYSHFRKKLFKDYKGNRDHEKDEQSRREFSSFRKQVAELKKLLPLLNIVQLTYKENEADDLIAIACQNLEGKKIVVSTDRDMLQLVRKDVDVFAPLQRVSAHYTIGNFINKTGLTPRQYLHMRVLTGDAGDNIPGVAKGFGEKSAIELILKYRSLKNLFCDVSMQEIRDSKNARHALLCEPPAKQNAYRNMLLMDLGVAAEQNRDHQNILNVLKESLANRQKINHAEIKRRFLKRAFKSLLSEGVGTWLEPFETLDLK